MNDGKLIRVVNTTAYPIGVRLVSGATRRIEPGGFTMMTADDIEYANHQSSPRKRPFSTKRLVAQTDIDTKEALDGVLDIGTDESIVYPTREEIEKKLRSNMNTLKKWLFEIESADILSEIGTVAAEMDLPASKAALLQERIPSLSLLGD